ncbi:ABC transporter substrate-binding protein [Pseudonocardiaceae bacterium YIM PH 21723]|nr:ABC transporter substrate-binding protein [Pseudonocardiaceae bacterium YIM PH 21723]
MRVRCAALALVLITVTGCSTSPAATPGGVGKSTTVANTLQPLSEKPQPRLPVTVTSRDREKGDHPVTVTSADRILPLTGALSEVVFTLGLGDKVIGRDVAATFPEAKDLPLVTRGHGVNAEGVLSLKPTVILAEEDTGPASAMDQLRAAGVPIVFFRKALKVEDVRPRITDVAEALGVPDAGKKLADRTDGEIKDAQQFLAKPEKALTIAFLYVRGTAGVYLLGGKTSGADSLIQAIGAQDAGTKLNLPNFTPLTTEALISAAPDVILVMTKGLESVGGVDGLVALQGVAQTPAGRDRRVVDVDDGALLNYGPRTAQVLNMLAAKVYQK